jgi:predicted porin
VLFLLTQILDLHVQGDILMKKLALTTVALAALGCAAGAQAQLNQGTHLMMTGSLYGGVAYNQGAGGAKNYGTLAAPASMMFRGREDLGGGNAVYFKLENDISLATGAVGGATAGSFSKQAFVGIQGKWGNLRAGKMYTSSFSTMALIVDPTGTYSVISGTNLMETHYVRFNNGIIYNYGGFDPYSYARNGFAFAASHFFGSGADQSAGGYQRNASSAVNIGYAGYGFAGEMSYQRTNVYTSPTSDQNFRSFLIGGSYKFSFAKVHFGYGQQKTRNAGAGNALTKDSKDFVTGLTMPLGPGNLMASWIRKNDKLNNNRAYMIGVNYDYPLSKRTKLTLGAVKMGNSSNAKVLYRVTSGYAGDTAAGARSASVVFGLTHYF